MRAGRDLCAHTHQHAWGPLGPRWPGGGCGGRALPREEAAPTPGGAGWGREDPAPPPDSCCPRETAGSLTFGKSCSLDLEREEEVRAKQTPGARGGLRGWTSSVTCG